MHTGGAESRGKCAARGDRLDAPGVATPADGVAGIWNLDVSDIARRALRATVNHAVDDDPAADTGADFHEQQVADRRAPTGPVLPHRHDVHVVVDQHRHTRELVGEKGRHGDAVPAGHDRRADHPTGGELDRPGQTHAHAFDTGDGAAGAIEQRVEAIQGETQTRIGARGDVKVGRFLDEYRTRPIAHRETALGRAEVGREDYTAVGVERQARRWSTAGGLAIALLDNEAGGGRRASTRWEMVERARPVTLTRSLRVAHCPLRISCSTVPAPPATGPPAIPGVYTSDFVRSRTKVMPLRSE